MDGSFEEKVHALVERLLGADPAQCASARDELLALGGFSHPYIREVLRQESAETGLFHGRLGGHALGAVVGRGGFGIVYRTNPVEGASGPCCLKVGYVAGGGSARVTRLAGPVEAATSRGVPMDQACADAWHEDAKAGDATGEEVQEIVLEEAALLRALEGDLLPRVHASGVEGDAAWYAMDCFEGPTVRELLRRGEAGALPMSRLVARVCRELADLNALDGRFFHGDLKPENLVFLGERLRAIDPALRRDQGRLRATLTVAYNPMALTGEQADTCALALTLLEVLFARRPFGPWKQPSLEARDAGGPERRRLLQIAPDEATTALERRLLEWVLAPPTYRQMDRELRRLDSPGS